MAEPVFGLTSGAAKVLGEVVSDFRQRLPAVGRRTRRVWPQGDRLTLLQYDPGETKILGRFSPQANLFGLAHVITDAEAYGIGDRTSDSISDDDVYVDFHFLQGTVLFPGMTVWATPAGVKFGSPELPAYWAVSGGVSFFKATVTDDPGVVIPQNDITDYDSVDITQFCGEIFTEDQIVGVQVCDTVLYVTIYCCPPSS